MIPEIKKILYTTDLSENARYAFGYAASMANQYGAKITILHVLEDFSSNTKTLVVGFLGEERWQEVRKKKEQEFLDTVMTRLDKFCEDMKSELEACPFLVDEIITRQGNAAQEILLQAQTGDYDILVMGTHGQGIMADALMGSTARRVVRRCKKPVLVVRLPEKTV